MSRQCVDRAAGKANAASIMTQSARDAIHECTFAGTVGSDKADALTRLNREIYFGKRHETVEALAQRSDFEQRGQHHDATVERRATRPMIPLGASTTNPTRMTPTMSRLISEAIVTVATC